MFPVLFPNPVIKAKVKFFLYFSIGGVLNRKDLFQRGDQQLLTVRPANGEDGAVAVPVLPLRVIPTVWTKVYRRGVRPICLSRLLGGKKPW